MTQDISGFGLRVVVQASSTFPSGITLTQFADDADPLDLASLQIADKAMGLNGNMVTWSKANPVPMVVNVVPGTTDDQNMQILLSANRASAGRRPARDIITATVVYPDGRTLRCMRGKITDGPFGNSVASAGRMKSKGYTFAFEDVQ